MTIAIYDMDRTLTRRGTWTPWLKHWLRTEAPWRVVLLPLLALPVLAFEAGWVDRGGLKRWAHRIVMGKAVPMVQVERAAATFAATVVADDVFSAARGSIEADRTAGRRLVIATASNQYYAQAIAAALGISDVIATQFLTRDKALLAQIDGENCYGDGKARMILAWLDAQGVADAAWKFYSDHVSDVPAFEAALASGGAAIAVNPSAALRAEALRRGWPVVDWGVPEVSLVEHA